jgi:hypothetical protein
MVLYEHTQRCFPVNLNKHNGICTSLWINRNGANTYTCVCMFIYLIEQM